MTTASDLYSPGTADKLRDARRRKIAALELSLARHGASLQRCMSELQSARASKPPALASISTHSSEMRVLLAEQVAMCREIEQHRAVISAIDDVVGTPERVSAPEVLS